MNAWRLITGLAVGGAVGGAIGWGLMWWIHRRRRGPQQPAIANGNNNGEGAGGGGGGAGGGGGGAGGGGGGAGGAGVAVPDDFDPFAPHRQANDDRNATLREGNESEFQEGFDADPTLPPVNDELAMRDFEWKIPHILAANLLNDGKLRLFSSPWSAPGDTKSLTCRVDGTHDIDMGWIDEILLNNSAVHIVPRFIFEGWTGAQLQHFLSEEQTQYRCVRALIDFLQRHNFNGAVIEIWLQIMSTTRGAAVEYLLELVEFWSEQFHKAGLQFILPLTPPLGANLQEIGIVNAEVVHRLLSAVDYINLMTYDFPNPEMAGVAPINWVEANLRYVINVAGGDANWAAPKILMGLNFYGYDRGDGTNSAVLGSRYMEMLAFPDAKLSFISNIGEHQLTFGPSGKVFYPSKRSIELRLQLAETMGLGGVAIWDLGQGLDHFTTVL